MNRAASLLLAAGLVFAFATPASATPTGSDPKTAAADAATWLGSQINASGFVPQAASPASANLSVTAQAVTALASAGVGRAKVAALLGYLGHHVDDFVAAGGDDDPGALAYLILAARAGGEDPSAFGSAHADLVARLVATQQPSGLFGSSDPSFDGAFREGLALLALHAAGVANPAGVAWLESQQCADGSYAPFRADTSTPCPPIDEAAFTGPDTNSTALAVLGLHAQGDAAPAAAGVTELVSVRNPAGGWGFLASSDQATDANSTGVVLEALRTVKGAADARGVAALLALQVGCAGAVADRGGIAFQPGAGGRLVPDAFATVQAIPALAEAALPIVAPAISRDLPAPCTSTTSTTTSTVMVTGTTETTATTSPAPDTTVAATAAQLPRTGSSPAPTAAVAIGLLAFGALLTGSARRRRR